MGYDGSGRCDDAVPGSVLLRFRAIACVGPSHPSPPRPERPSAPAQMALREKVAPPGKRKTHGGAAQLLPMALSGALLPVIIHLVPL